MEYPTSNLKIKEFLGQVIDRYPMELADVLMDRKPYLRDIERHILDNPSSILLVGMKVNKGSVQVLDVTVTHKYINKVQAGV